MLRSAGRSKERIVLFGMEGVGKSLAALDIASRIAPAKLYVIDNDNAWDRMLEGQTLAGDEVKVTGEYRWKDGDWEGDFRWAVEGGNVVVYHAEGWEGNVAAIAEVVAEANPEDWVCIDSGTSLWVDVQDWYTDTVYGQTLADYMLALKKGATTEDKDDPKWQVINAQYAQGVGKFLVSPPCHLLVTAEQKEVNVAKERDREIVNLYGAAHVRPAGQKRLGHQMQTMIHLTKNRTNTEFMAMTLKDRGGRERWEGEEITGRGFADWYLEEVAGWVDEAEDATPASPASPAAKAPAAKTPTPKAKG